MSEKNWVRRTNVVFGFVVLVIIIVLLALSFLNR